MGRRSMTPPTNRNVDGSRMSVGDNTVEHACTRLFRAARTEAQIMLDGRYNPEYMIRGFYSDDAIARLRAAMGFVQPQINYHRVTYTNHWLGADQLDGNTHTLTTSFIDTGVPTPTELALERHDDRIGSYLVDAGLAHAIHSKYGRVQWFLRHINRNWTPAAIRALWPSVLTLCPKSPMCEAYSEVPSRYIEPHNVGELLPVLRETAQTVAAMQLLPDVELRSDEGVQLTFNSGAHNATLEDKNFEFSYDALTFNL